MGGTRARGKAIGAVALVDVEDDSVGRPIRGQALELTYAAGGFGPRRRDSVLLTQIRAYDPARSYVEEAKTAPPGFADLQSRMAGSDQNRFRSWTASLRHSGFLLQIEGAATPMRRPANALATSFRPLSFASGASPLSLCGRQRKGDP